MFDFLKKKNEKEEKKKEEKDYILEKEEAYLEGLASVLDLIAPSAMKISSSHLELSDVCCRTIFIAVYPSMLSVGWLDSIIGTNIPSDIAIFVHPADSAKVLKQLRKKVTQIQSQINIELEKGLIRDPQLQMAYENVENLRDSLQEGLEKFFRVGVYVNIFGSDLEELDKATALIDSLLNSRSIYTKKAIFRMKEGFVSCLPLGLDQLLNNCALNTSPLSTIFPFVSADVTSNKGILYGINRHNNSLVLFDRFSMENANMVVFAKSGAGKSYTVKLEILRSLMVGTDAIIIDPEDEYRNLSEAVGGSYLKISLDADHRINPFDLCEEKEKEMRDILRIKISSLLGLLKVMLGRLTPEEESILERALWETYAIRDIDDNTAVSSLKDKEMPLLTDLYQVLTSMKEADDLGVRLEKYVSGIFSGFLNKPTNISLDSRLVIFNIRDLEDELRPVAMYLVLSYVWDEVRKNLKKRLIIVDEAWVMMQHEEAAYFVFSIAKRIRKYYGGLTTITQDIADFMSSKFGKAIVSNSSIQLLMKQSQSTIDAVADAFYLTDKEKQLLMTSGVGEGIFFAGLKRAAILVVASPSEDKLVTTNPEEKLKATKDEKEEY